MRTPPMYSFQNEIELVYNNSVYFVRVEGVRCRDEYDPMIYCTELEKVKIFDELDNPVEWDHPDYDDLMEEIYAYNFDKDSDYEEEGLDRCSYDLD